MKAAGAGGQRPPTWFRVAFVVMGGFLAAFPATLPMLAGNRLVENDWLALWGLMAVLGGYIVLFGWTVKKLPSPPPL